MEKPHDESLLRLIDIVGDKKRGIPPRISVSKTTWLNGVKQGIFPAPVRLGPRMAFWRLSDIQTLISKMTTRPAV